MTTRSNPTIECDRCGHVQVKPWPDWGRIPSGPKKMQLNGYVPDGASDRLDLCPDCCVSFCDWLLVDGAT